jgi:hypothetical protein
VTHQGSGSPANRAPIENYSCLSLSIDRAEIYKLLELLYIIILYRIIYEFHVEHQSACTVPLDACIGPLTFGCSVSESHLAWELHNALQPL